MCQKKENKKIFFRTAFLKAAPENRAHIDTRPGRLDEWKGTPCNLCGEPVINPTFHLCFKRLNRMSARAHEDPFNAEIQDERDKREGRDSF